MKARSFYRDRVATYAAWLHGVCTAVPAIMLFFLCLMAWRFMLHFGRWPVPYFDDIGFEDALFSYMHPVAGVLLWSLLPSLVSWFVLMGLLWKRYTRKRKSALVLAYALSWMTLLCESSSLVAWFQD
jgi:hypothetical protein